MDPEKFRALSFDKLQNCSLELEEGFKKMFVFLFVWYFWMMFRVENDKSCSHKLKIFF